MGDHLGDRSKSKRDTNRTNRTQSSGGKYESAPFWVPALKVKLIQKMRFLEIVSGICQYSTITMLTPHA